MIATARQGAAATSSTSKPTSPRGARRNRSTSSWPTRCSSGCPTISSLFADLVDHVAPDGWFAFQVPGNFDAPSHTAIRDLRRSARWRDRLDESAEGAVHTPEDYARHFLGLGLGVDAWETTYVQVLDG